MEEGSEGGGNDRVRNLQSEVEGVKNIMTQNVERILARGENLEHLRNKTEDLEATWEEPLGHSLCLILNSLSTSRRHRRRWLGSSGGRT
uniref:vesicle-associated membrane protein 8 isoform X2 n=1 Tax=Callithrix jacchus TaxID=9483 RepID=UPI0004F05005|nr:vesicle-associated membrane protein 8 isoform X2 [Callithrix jacchus]